MRTRRAGAAVGALVLLAVGPVVGCSSSGGSTAEPTTTAAPLDDDAARTEVVATLDALCADIDELATDVSSVAATGELGAGARDVGNQVAAIEEHLDTLQAYPSEQRSTVYDAMVDDLEAGIGRARSAAEELLAADPGAATRDLERAVELLAQVRARGAELGAETCGTPPPEG